MKRTYMIPALCLALFLICASACRRSGVLQQKTPAASDEGPTQTAESLQTTPTSIPTGVRVDSPEELTAAPTAAETESVPETEAETESAFQVDYNDVGKAVVTVPGPKDPRPAYDYSFQPHVCSEICRMALGEAVEQEIFAFEDAAFVGADAFPCTGEENWARVNAAMQENLPLSVFLDIGERFDPALLKGGQYPISYRISKDAYLKKVEDFRTRVTALIQSADLRAGDTDLEKALKLYTEESLRCEYNYRTYDAFKEGNYSANAYTALTTDKGICQEFAGAYAYLLQQVGVEASTVDSRMTDDNVHGWTVLRLDGSLYYADVTWNLREPYSLRFFGVTDRERRSNGVLTEYNDFGGYGIILNNDLQITDRRFCDDFPYVKWYRIDHEAQQLLYYYDSDFDPTNPKCYTGEIAVFSLRP